MVTHCIDRVPDSSRECFVQNGSCSFTKKTISKLEISLNQRLGLNVPPATLVICLYRPSTETEYLGQSFHTSIHWQKVIRNITVEHIMGSLMSEFEVLFKLVSVSKARDRVLINSVHY